MSSNSPTSSATPHNSFECQFVGMCLKQPISGAPVHRAPQLRGCFREKGCAMFVAGFFTQVATQTLRPLSTQEAKSINILFVSKGWVGGVMLWESFSGVLQQALDDELYWCSGWARSSKEVARFLSGRSLVGWSNLLLFFSSELVHSSRILFINSIMTSSLWCRLTGTQQFNVLDF